MSGNFLKPYIIRRKNGVMNVSRGFSLIDIVVGAALFLVVFLSLAGVFRISIGVVAHSKARVGALAVAQERIESIRSLSYDDIGTQGGIPNGSLLQEDTVVLNGIEYHRRTLVQYVDSDRDGLGEADANTIPTDYKVVKVEVTWDVGGVEKSVSSVTHAMPPGIETNQGGGTLKLQVFDALLQPIQGALVHIENSALNPIVSTNVYTDENGRVTFPGSPSGNGYEITVSDTGYTADQTYSVSAELPTPVPGHLSVLEGETTEASFQIDEVASLEIATWFPIREDDHTDDMTTTDDMQSFEHISISGGTIVLSNSGSGYELSGSAVSEDIAPEYIAGWKSFSWIDETPLGTDILYRIYDTDTDTLLPEGVVSGNAAGFSDSPVDLSGVSHETYPGLFVRADLTTTSTSTTPVLDKWVILYDEGPIPVGNVPFTLSGEKSIGFDGGGAPVLAYEEDLITNAFGTVTIADLVWDTYHISVLGASSGYDVQSFCDPKPHVVNPGEEVHIDVYLTPHSDHSLLVAVYSDVGDPVPAGIDVMLSRPGYGETLTTGSCGQVLFTDLFQADDYTITVPTTIYGSFSDSDIVVSGASFTTVSLE
ncbi:MAG: carboxypeptidase regulatory-like domain-containing protein [Parcubacteria group bacterium]|nr:carboxypeptidase regulatory-like domain-containing protein [Parcubacteria group bacterium]